MTPTPEQQVALGHFAAGEPLVVQARAGTGKTSTLRLMAAATRRRGQYMAFNRAIVDEASQKFPAHVGCATAHSLAFRAVGRRYAHRLQSARMRSADIAQALGLGDIWVTLPGGRKRLAPGYLAGHVMRAIGAFCASADEIPGRQHFPYIDGIDMCSADGRRGWANNREVAAHCEAALHRAWADLQDPDGQQRFSHEHYLKMWQLQQPRIPAEFVVVDEAQDLSPVMLSIVAQQADHAQLVYVGDDQQQIYGWMGAVNALGTLRAQGASEAVLTQSFRFGPQIATLATRVLDMLDARPGVTGTPTISSSVGPVADPDAILCRTNAMAVEQFLSLYAAGRRPHLLGGGSEVAAFCRGAIHLMEEGWTAHPELACFGSWGEVQTYVEEDPQGSELRLLVELIDRYGAERILAGLSAMPRRGEADLTISTAHKSKGCEWGSVRLAGDFPGAPEEGEEPPEAEELRLLYVAVTRARLALDVSACSLLVPRPAQLALGAA